MTRWQTTATTSEKYCEYFRWLQIELYLPWPTKLDMIQLVQNEVLLHYWFSPPLPVGGIVAGVNMNPLRHHHKQQMPMASLSISALDKWSHQYFSINPQLHGIKWFLCIPIESLPCCNTCYIPNVFNSGLTELMGNYGIHSLTKFSHSCEYLLYPSNVQYTIFRVLIYSRIVRLNVMKLWGYTPVMALGMKFDITCYIPIDISKAILHFY